MKLHYKLPMLHIVYIRFGMYLYISLNYIKYE